LQEVTGFKVNTVLVDLQLGDCGKGKIADHLMEEHDICVRYSGGPNTGTTVWTKGTKYKLHHLPVGLLRNKPSYIAQTCLVNTLKLGKEIEELKAMGFDVEKNLKISPHCHMITQEHVERDVANETSGISSGGVGSTKQGISPCSQDKYARKGIRLIDREPGHWIERYFADVPLELNTAIRHGKSILFQSSQGTMLDIDHGNYPYVSTTSNIAGAAAMACGLGPQYINKVIGVFKPYLTYVGVGDFPTEIDDEQVNATIAERGYEYGTTTGRRRRIGWLDLPALAYACMINGVQELAVTKADVLENMPVKYSDRCLLKNGASIHLPFDHKYKACFKEADNVKDLLYIVIEDLKRLYDLNLKLKYISTGKDREEMRIL
jgi:adenylosuccinate synthase